MLLPLAAFEWNYRSSNFINKAKTGNYTLLNKAGVYNLNVLMGTTGYIAGYKEVAIETLLLGVPGKGDVVSLNSDFAMESKKVRSKIQNHINSGRSTSKYAISWTKKEHLSDSSRVALAVNSPAHLAVKTTKDSSGKTIYDCSIKASIKYPDGARTKIVLGHPDLYIVMDEAIFSGMQKHSVFEAYTVKWNWEISKDDVSSHRDLIWIDDILEKIISIG